jgi:hypothetical protein
MLSAHHRLDEMALSLSECIKFSVNAVDLVGSSVHTHPIIPNIVYLAIHPFSNARGTISRQLEAIWRQDGCIVEDTRNARHGTPKSLTNGGSTAQAGGGPADVIAGDPSQTDRRSQETSGMTDHL